MTRFRPAPVQFSVIVYRFLLVLYPSAHRQAYGPLMIQLFRDLCRDAHAQRGFLSLIPFWLRTLFDLGYSALIAHIKAVEEMIMAVNRMTPMPWRDILLVILPGVLFGLTRIYTPFSVLATISIVLILLLTLVMFWRQRHWPAWGLLIAGLILNWCLLALNILFAEWVARPLRYNYDLIHWLVAIPLWVAVIGLGWRYRQPWRGLVWILPISALVVVGSAIALGVDVLTTVGFMLLPVMVGLPLARRCGLQAMLFVVGALCIWLFDSDYFGGGLLQSWPYYPVYALALVWLLMSVAPLLFLRGRTLRHQAIGLFIPILLFLIARVVVPWWYDQAFHPQRIWLGDALLSVMALAMLVLAFVLYARTDRMTTTAPIETSQPVYAG